MCDGRTVRSGAASGSRGFPEKHGSWRGSVCERGLQQRKSEDESGGAECARVRSTLVWLGMEDSRSTRDVKREAAVRQQTAFRSRKESEGGRKPTSKGNLLESKERNEFLSVLFLLIRIQADRQVGGVRQGRCNRQVNRRRIGGRPGE